MNMEASFDPQHCKQNNKVTNHSISDSLNLGQIIRYWFFLCVCVCVVCGAGNWIFGLHIELFLFFLFQDQVLLNFLHAQLNFQSSFLSFAKCWGQGHKVPHPSLVFDASGPVGSVDQGWICGSRALLPIAWPSPRAEGWILVSPAEDGAFVW